MSWLIHLSIGFFANQVPAYPCKNLTWPVSTALDSFLLFLLDQTCFVFQMLHWSWIHFKTEVEVNVYLIHKYFYIYMTSINLNVSVATLGEKLSRQRELN